MNLIEITQKFPTELDCIIYAEKIRYGKKPKCAYCDSTNLSKRNKDYRYLCKDCNKSSSVTVGTIIQGTRVPLQTWFFAISVITDAKKGMSALQLQRNINVSYPTAFAMYHKLRVLMAEENKNVQELDGIVEMDEKYIGGKPRKLNHPHVNEENMRPRLLNKRAKKHAELEKDLYTLKKEGWDFTPQGKNRSLIQQNKKGRGTDNIPIVGIVQRDGNVVAEVMRHLTYEKLREMVKKYVDEDKSLLITDNYQGYKSMKKIIDHIKIDHSMMYSYKGVNSNTIESFWAIIERGIMGQYHSVTPKMLPNYVAEFVYKYNNRENNPKMFDDLVHNMLKPTSL